jgi:hypothetical protein
MAIPMKNEINERKIMPSNIARTLRKLARMSIR